MVCLGLKKCEQRSCEFVYGNIKPYWLIHNMHLRPWADHAGKSSGKAIALPKFAE